MPTASLPSNAKETRSQFRSGPARPSYHGHFHRRLARRDLSQDSGFRSRRTGSSLTSLRSLPRFPTAAISRNSSKSTPATREGEQRYSPADVVEALPKADHGRSRPHQDLHVPHRAPEPHDSDADAPHDPIDERLSAKSGKTSGPPTASGLPTTISAGFTRRCASRRPWKRGITDHVWDLAELLV